MQKRSIAALAFSMALFALGDARAQSMNSPQGPCRDLAVTSELVQCFDAAFKAADAKLNRTYAQTMRRLSPRAAKSLTAAERQWIAYRDATCAAERDVYENGTGGPPTYLACLEAETRAREESLRRSFGWLDER